MYSCFLSYNYEHFFFEATFSKSIIFKVKSTFEPNVFKTVIKQILINSSPFALLVMNVKCFPISKRNGAHLVEKKKMFEKKRIVHFRSLNASNMQIFKRKFVKL